MARKRRKKQVAKRDRGALYLSTPRGPILNLAVLAQEIINEWLHERGMAPTSQAAAEALAMTPSTIKEVAKGGRGISAEMLSYPIAAIAGGSPGAFFQRHELMRGEAEELDRDEAEVQEMLRSFTSEEKKLLISRAVDIKRLGHEPWENFKTVIEAMHATATGRRQT